MKSLLAKAAAAFVLAATLASLSAEPVRYDARPGSKLKIDGTSTVHDWTVESGIIGGYIEFDSNFPLDPAQASPEMKVAPKVEVTIPVRSLKSGKSLMDEVMHDAMKVKDYPKIVYTLTEMKLKDPARKPGSPLEFDTKGDLTVAGVKKPVEFVVTLTPTADGKLKATGEKTVKMTDYGISPPAPKVALGFIKTGDDVKITFEWVTAKKDEKKTASAN
jgi:polyisoprenoid-binding protein YceI